MSATALVCRPVAVESFEACMETELARLLCEKGMEVLVVPEPYHIPEDSELWAQLAELTGPIALLCHLHPRAARWLMRRHGIGEAGLHVFDLRQHETADTAVEALHELEWAECGLGRVVEMGRSVTERWYPVVDESRCTNCQHCLQFCIFGVYGTDESGRVSVLMPDNCKPGCPACARICPNSAIMFPLCQDDQAIAGAPGKLVTLEPPARRMYYARTGAECPQCGQSGKAAGGNQAAERCPECGRPLCREATSVTEDSSEVLAEIDSLVQQLEDMSRGGQ